MRQRQGMGQLQQATRRSRDTRGDSVMPMQAMSMYGGGPVNGVGGPTEDANLRALSDGEHVLPTDTVTAVGAGSHARGARRLNKLIKKTHRPVRQQMTQPAAGLATGMADGGENRPDGDYVPGRDVIGLADGGNAGSIDGAVAAIKNRQRQLDAQEAAILGKPAQQIAAPPTTPATPAPVPPKKKGLLGLGILGLAGGGSVSPWADEYAKGGSLNVSAQPAVSTAPIASNPTPAATAAPATAAAPLAPSVTVPTAATPASAATAPAAPAIPSYGQSASAPLTQGVATSNVPAIGGDLSLSSTHGSLATRPGNFERLNRQDLSSLTGEQTPGGFANGGSVSRYQRMADGGEVRYGRPPLLPAPIRELATKILGAKAKVPSMDNPPAGSGDWPQYKGPRPKEILASPPNRIDDAPMGYYANGGQVQGMARGGPVVDMTDEEWNRRVAGMPTYDAKQVSVPPPTLYSAAPPVRVDEPAPIGRTMAETGQAGETVPVAAPAAPTSAYGVGASVRQAISGAATGVADWAQQRNAGLIRDYAVPAQNFVRGVVGAEPLPAGVMRSAAATPTQQAIAGAPASAAQPYRAWQGEGDRPQADWNMNIPVAKRTTPYTEVDETPSGPVAVPGGMTTEEANRYYGAINAQNRANDAQNHNEAQRQMTLASRSIGDRLDAERAAWAAKVDASSILNGPDVNAHHQGFGSGPGRAKALLSAEEAHGARARADSSRAAYEATLAGPNLAAQAMGAQNAGEQAQRAVIADTEARQAMAQRGILNPLAVTAEQQKVELGKYGVQGAAARQQILGELGQTTDPERHTQLMAALYGMEGKIYEPYKGITVGGGVNPVTGLAQPAQFVSYNQLSGRPAFSQTIGATPPQEGTVGADPNEGKIFPGKEGTPYAGKKYKIVNGQPVEQR